MKRGWPSLLASICAVIGLFGFANATASTDSPLSLERGGLELTQSDAKQCSTVFEQSFDTIVATSAAEEEMFIVGCGGVF